MTSPEARSLLNARLQAMVEGIAAPPQPARAYAACAMASPSRAAGASAPESLMVQMLLQTPGVQLLDFAQHEAYARRFPFLSPVTLPRGVVDLASNVPARDVRMVASTTSLLARESTHPALLTLFAQRAQEVHSELFLSAQTAQNAPAVPVFPAKLALTKT